MEESTLHGWIYARVCEVCGDREYLYRSYVSAFCSFMESVYAAGSVAGSGTHVVPGLKSGRQAVIRWRLQRQVNFQGPNTLRVQSVVTDDAGRTEGAAASASFELSSGESA